VDIAEHDWRGQGLPEQGLIARAQGGEAAAFEALVARHAPFVYNLALRTLGDPHEAEDVAQEAFARAWRGLPGFRADARFSTWLYRIVTNLCYNRLPALRTSLEALDIESGRHLADERQHIDGALVADELRARVHAAIYALPEGYRLLITLRHLQEMSYADIATVTGLPLGTVKTGLHRARKQLQAALQADEGVGAWHGATRHDLPEPVRTDPRSQRSAYECTRLEVNHA